MFSGIVDAIGTLREARPAAGGRVLRVEAADYWSDVPGGASMAVNGVCLTLTNKDRNVADFDVIAETLRRTTLGDLKAGDRVNLQKSLAVGDRIDGHFVQGHVDAVGRVSRVEESERESVWWIQIDAESMAYVTPKGSIAVDGVSLTIASLADNEFSVALIPTTLQNTTLANKRPGARVNVETDILARTLVEYLRRMARAENGASTGDTPLRQGLH
ncbi:MAG TPA: riboflavin synthase [Phycisphaerae bacterium]|nr:riboflavin synthase [Phycisphaerae bacterium]